jgi:hypothetical protein
MYDQEIPASQIKADRFPFPCEGDITLAFRNKNYALGPVMLHIVMKPGSVIPAHLHEGVSVDKTGRWLEVNNFQFGTVGPDEATLRVLQR